jgi:hypothetical protein
VRSCSRGVVSYRIQKSDDLETVRELHKLAFPSDPWPGDDHEFWLVYDDGTDPQTFVGFASAIYLEDLKCVFLSRAAITQAASARGLQRRLIRVRTRWARSISGCQFAWTYCERWNYACLFNLLRCRFRAATRHRWGTAWHILWTPLTNKKRPPMGALLKLYGD